MGHRILILDDDADFNSLLTDIFSQAGYDITPEQDPQKALSLIREFQFDLVVTDQRMPGISGKDFLRELKKVQPKTPIIMVSGFLDNETIRELIRDGVGGVFLKPLNVFSLLKRTAKLLEQAAGNTQRGKEAKLIRPPRPNLAIVCHLPLLPYPARMPSLRNLRTNCTRCAISSITSRSPDPGALILPPFAVISTACGKSRRKSFFTSQTPWWRRIT